MRRAAVVVVAEVVAAEAVARGTAMEAAVETVAAPEPEQAPRRAAPVSAVLQAQAEDTAVVRGEPAAAVPLVPRVLGGQVSAAHRVLAVPAPRVVRAQAGPTRRGLKVKQKGWTVDEDRWQQRISTGA